MGLLLVGYDSFLIRWGVYWPEGIQDLTENLVELEQLLDLIKRSVKEMDAGIKKILETSADEMIFEEEK